MKRNALGALTLMLAGRAMTLAFVARAGGGDVGDPPSAWLMPLLGDAVIGVSAIAIALAAWKGRGLLWWTAIVVWNFLGIWDALAAYDPPVSAVARILHDRDLRYLDVLHRYRDARCLSTSHWRQRPPQPIPRRPMNRTYSSAVIVVVIALLGAQPADADPKTRPSNDPSVPNLGWVGLELDPLTTPLGARNLFVYLEPPSLPHWSVSLGVFASDFPDRVDELLSYRNRNRDFDIKVRLSPGLTIDYFLAGKRHKWHVGLMSFLWRYEVERNGDVATFTNHVILPRVGYRWFPFESVNVYLDPFVGLMTEYKVAGEANVDGDEVKPTPIIPFATAHLGFHF